MHSGGDEFICWSDTVEPEYIYKDKLQSLITEIDEKIHTNTDCQGIHVSIGATSSVNSGRAYENISADAYKALYYAKKIGKNQIDIYHNGKYYQTIPKEGIKHDLDTIASMISEESDYKGAYHTDYIGFEKIYNLLRNISNRYLDNVQLILFTIEFEARGENVTERELAMNMLESSIVVTLRKSDVTARYSSTQQLLLLMNINDENMKMITDRIRKEFYRMYDKGNVTLLTSTKNVSMEKMKFRNQEQHS